MTDVAVRAEVLVKRYVVGYPVRDTSVTPRQVTRVHYSP
jgi:hypothetical protein